MNCPRRPRSTAKATPLPLLKVTVVAIVLFVNQFGSLMLFPFLPFMVHDFFPHLSREELGQKAGYLGSAFFLGNFIGSFAWGWASDVFGRKPVMQLGLVFTIGTELLFGFSQNFGWAVSARFMWGMLNGNLGVAKTYISEVCDDSNQAKGFSAIGTGSGIGRLVGSVVGGFLSQPASKYSAFETPFFCKFPYALPCIVGAIISVFSLIAATLFLDETLHKSKRGSGGGSDGVGGSDGGSEGQTSTDSGIELSRQLQDEDDPDAGDSSLAPNSSLAVMESDIDSETDGGLLRDVTSDTELLIDEREEPEKSHRGRVGRMKRWSYSWNPDTIVKRTHNRARQCSTCCGACVTTCVNCTPRQAAVFTVSKLKLLLLKLLEVAKLMTDRKVLLSTSIYGIYGALHVMASETFPLLMVTCYHHGGYHLDSNEIGLIIMISGVAQLVWQLCFYPHVTKCLGYRHTLQLGIVFFIACYLILPFSNRITGPISSPTSGPCSEGGGGGDVNSSSSESIFSGSGSGGGGGGPFDNYSNTTNDSSTSYCSVDYEIGVNHNSIQRVPLRVWTFLFVLMVLLVISRISGFVSVFILIGNSSFPETRGSVNGIAQSVVAIGRAVGPIVGSLVFAWSTSNGYGWPLDYHFVFNFVAAFGVVLIIISLFLPKSIERKRERPN